MNQIQVYLHVLQIILISLIIQRRELLKIAKLMLEDQQYQLTPDAEIALTQYIERRKEKPLFANARSVKNALDRARMRQANRIFDSRGQVLTKKELVNLEAQDILQSTVFKIKNFLDKYIIYI